MTLASALSVSTSAAPPAQVHAAQVPQGAIVLDGALHEAAWRQAPVLTLTQQDPHPGQPTPYVTTVRVLRDSSHLYFGVICTDPDPANLAVHHAGGCRTAFRRQAQLRRMPRRTT